MKKKILALISIMLVAVLAVSFAACNKADSGETTAVIQGADGPTAAPAEKLVMGYTIFAPMGYEDENGEIIGFDVDVAKEVASRLGRELQLQLISWDAKDAELATGTIDMIWNGFTMSEDRLAQYEWTDPYMLNKQVIVVLSGSEIKTADDLAGKSVAVEEGSSALELLQGDSFTESVSALRDGGELGKGIIACDTYVDALENLKAGLVDAVIMDSVAADYYAAQDAGRYAQLDEVLADEEYGVGFLKGNTELRDAVQGALEEMAADGKLAEISAKWFGKDVTTIGK